MQFADICLLLEPALLLGIGAGVVLNVIFPSWIIVILLTLLLTCETRWRHLLPALPLQPKFFKWCFLWEER